VFIGRKTWFRITHTPGQIGAGQAARQKIVKELSRTYNAFPHLPTRQAKIF
jgi:hypothetical protein